MRMLCPQCGWGLVMDWHREKWWCHRCNAHVWKTKGRTYVRRLGDPYEPHRK